MNHRQRYFCNWHCSFIYLCFVVRHIDTLLNPSSTNISRDVPLTPKPWKSTTKERRMISIVTLYWHFQEQYTLTWIKNGLFVSILGKDHIIINANLNVKKKISQRAWKPKTKSSDLSWVCKHRMHISLKSVMNLKYKVAYVQEIL